MKRGWTERWPPPRDVREVSVWWERIHARCYLDERGHYPTRLNHGDCFAYAMPLVLGEPLLFKGHDLSQTDIEPALKD